MNAASQRKHSFGLSILLVFFALVYVPGAIYLFLSWIGVQSHNPESWQHQTLPLYALVFVIAAIGVSGIWRWKKWGTYWLIGAWGLTQILNSLYVSSARWPSQYSFLPILFVIAFFLFLLPA